MSTIIVNRIIGQGIYEVPDDDADLSAAEAGLDSLLGPIVGLSYGNLFARVDTTDGAAAERTLRCILQDFRWQGELCPDASETIALTEAIASALIADPDIIDVQSQNVELFTDTGIYPSGQGYIYVTDVAAIGAEEVVSSKTYQDAGNTVLQSCTSSTVNVQLDINASYPRCNITTLAGTTAVTLTAAGGGAYYTGTATIALDPGGETVRVKTVSPNNIEGAVADLAIAVDTPPEVTNVQFTGGYPGAQTELKAGDTFQLTGTTSKTATQIQILGPASRPDSACVLATIPIAAGTSFTVTGTIADQGTTLVARPAYVKAGNAAGAFGSDRSTNFSGAGIDGTNLVNCNNLYPTVTIGVITYPPTQAALKGSESATVAVTTANLDTIAYDSPTSELSILNPTLIEPTKTVTRIAGSYNDSIANFRGTANRAANNATTASSTVVEIANVIPQITVTEPAARLRSGGNNGTSIQNHTITITSNQNLGSAPSISPQPSAGVFIGSWVGGPKAWTRVLQVHDNDLKGTFTWQSPSATNNAGLTTNTITGDNQYVLGGFVARNLTFGAFSQSTTLNVAVTNYSKISAGIFTSTNQPAVRHTPQGDQSNATDEYTILSPLGVNPQTLWWNDVAAASANSSGTAQITNVQESV